MKNLTLALLSAAMTIAVTATADEPPARSEAEVEVRFKSYDRNDDQRISRTEARQEKSLQRRFAAVDSDADGFLTREEYRARPSTEKFE